MVRLILSVFLIASSSLAWGMAGAPESSMNNTAAPEFTLETTSGRTLSLTQARNGKKAIMFFWATWCPHCHEELERIRQNAQKIKADGVEVLLVNAGETVGEAKSFLKRQGIALESLVDEDNTVSGQYHVIGIPTVFLIDEKGVIKDVSHEFPSDYNKKF